VWRRAAKVSRPQLEVMAQTPSSEQRLYTSRQLRWARRQQDRLVLPAKFLAGIAWSGTTAGTGSSAIENNDACPAIFASVFRRFVGRNGMKFGVPRPRCAGLPSEALDENANQIGSACCRRFPFGFQAAAWIAISSVWPTNRINSVRALPTSARRLVPLKTIRAAVGCRIWPTFPPSQIETRKIPPKATNRLAKLLWSHGLGPTRSSGDGQMCWRRSAGSGARRTAPGKMVLWN
jgi:hypothetical protein